MRLLLLSNSTLPGEPFLGWARPMLSGFIGSPKRIAFVPYAAVGLPYGAYTERVAVVMRELGHEVIGLDEDQDPKAIIQQADVIAVGGGNSFQLLRLLHRHDLIRAIRARVQHGVPFVGWSAGSNVACPTIMTTNDMPITEPPTFRSLGLVPFQINPHFTEDTIPGHGGESREQRIAEFLVANPDMPVVGLREGSLLDVQGDEMILKGRDIKLFRAGKETTVVADGTVMRRDLKGS